MPAVLTGLLAWLAFTCAPTFAQSLHLDRVGAPLGETIDFEIQGDPGAPYLLLFSFWETEIDLGGGEILEVGFEFVGLSVDLPGFSGFLDGSGRATASLPLPEDPLLEGVVLSFQAMVTNPVQKVSELIRVVGTEAGTFQGALEEPEIPIAGNGIASIRPDGSVFILPALSPVTQSYDPDRQEFDTGAVLCAMGALSSAAALEDGRLLVAGGLGLDGQPTDLCYLVDPDTLLCTELRMSIPRAGHAMALTSRGEILISGGFANLDFTDLLSLFAGIQNTTEIFDPVTETLRPGPNITEPKAFHSATTTADGDVLVAGGLTLIPIINIPFVSNTAYKFDTSDESFGFLPIFFSQGRLLHGAAGLDNGEVLLAGGLSIDFEDFLNSGDIADLAVVALDSGELWDDGFLGGSFDSISGLQTGRALPAVEPLPGGEALIAGGFQLVLSGDLTELEFSPQATADILVGNSFEATGSMSAPRIDPITTTLEDGSILLLGGGGAPAEIYWR